MSRARNRKICAYCGSTFLVPGACRDYLYKHGSTYYCGYNHWTAAERGKRSMEYIKRK